MITKSRRWPLRTVETFFDIWSPNTAYILGYFASDGTMYKNKRGSYYLAFTSTDPELITQVKNIMQVKNKIEVYKHKLNNNWKLRYTLQIGSKVLFMKLISLGFTPNKSLTLKYPPIPDEFLAHFLRGYFDGDGCASFAHYKRKNRNSLQKVLSIRIRCGSKEFIQTLQSKLIDSIGIGPGSLYFHSGAYDLAYSTHDVVKLFRFMYPGDNIPYLERKFRVLQEGVENWDRSSVG